jgi:predicted secreted protein
MKKFILLIALTVGIISLAGCGGYEVGTTVEDGAWKVIGTHGQYDMLRDLKTGCVYLQASADFSLTPYIGEDGKVVGCGQQGIFVEDKYTK